MDHCRNVKIKSKYIAGVKSGGEFFDIFQRDGQIVIFLSSASFYADSTIIMAQFEKLRNDRELSEKSLQNFMALFKEEDGASDDWKSLNEVQLFLMKIDCANKKAFGYNLGGAEILSDFQLLPGNRFSPIGNDLEKAQFAFDISVGKRIVIVSPGLKRNYREFSSEEILREIVLEKKEISGEELALEVFAMLKKDREDDFLDYDASLILLEVGKDV